MSALPNGSAPVPSSEEDEDPLAYSLSTVGIHGDDHLNAGSDIAPPIHVSTTFRYVRDAEALKPFDVNNKPDFLTAPHVYSRVSNNNTTRFEALLSTLLHGHALTYASGLAAFNALLTFFRPNVIAIGGGYHGCHGIVALHQKLYQLKKVDLFDEKSWDEAGLGKGDIVHLETPLNPTGECFDIRHFAELARKRGAYLSVDATFGPPGLQKPFGLGADVVMHSGTKYIGGHSDMLCGVLAVNRKEWWEGLFGERLLLGSVMGSLEGWLGVRSLRTLELRVKRQSESTTKLVQWLHDSLSATTSDQKESNKATLETNIPKTVLRIRHASLQPQDPWLRAQMPHGYGPVFSLEMRTTEAAKRLPSKLKLFHHATSLGGVESLIEWRKMSDPSVDDKVLRVSVGVEGWEDLREDFRGAFGELVREGWV